MTAPRGLAYWIRTIDRLLDEQVADAVEAAGLDRAAWPVLARLQLGSVRAEEAGTLLGPLTGGDVRGVLDRLVSDGLTEVRADEYRLTPAGEERVAALQDGPVRAVSDRATGDLDPAEAERVSGVLEQVARNLGWLAPA
ncbi:hypothetical protein JK386_08615 [Nocardioides sp. zg-536]|uniref:MarR family transcriptional regulator n=1 Tax=Nocardioides faecalis TaxID=2803858 RepID=A0A938Y9Y0_9ACTN|nr:hypothetical protein [Nocardioides faecalis]MBM9459964.1 hypothetical protein [Nocardioides faecalis]MBS4753166.1 hypothetical protein [Nocardioides faecalis]QVI58812.1 hypothetical protein KG111_17980 [Nocardioides faecalis]